MTLDLLMLVFFVLLGACVGSFLNVVVWRLPRGLSIVRPASRCPTCGTTIAWRDNVPVVGWLMLGGKCRSCRGRISFRYPMVELFTALLFAALYCSYFFWQHGPCAPSPPMTLDDLGRLAPLHRALTFQQDWPIFTLHLFLLGCLLAASLIDAELYLIPLEIPYLAALVGLVTHALVDHPALPGALNTSPGGGALALGSAVGVALSAVFLWTGVLSRSYATGAPMLEVEKETLRDQPEAHVPDMTRAQHSVEMTREMLFLLPPMLLGAAFCAATLWVAPVDRLWSPWMASDWLSGLMGSLLGALVGAGVVWVTRILGTLAFGREAMGLGDVHLMFGVGAVVGAGPAVVAFFLAPFFGMALAVYMLLTGKRRELPYGPYLGLGTAAALVFYCPIIEYLMPGLSGLGIWVRNLTGI